MSNGRESIKTNLNSASSFPKDVSDKTNVFRAAIYARTDQADQSDRYVQQVNCCSEYVKEKGWRLVDLFLDEGMSGKAIERPNLRLMLTKAAQYSFEVVVVSSLDRISRSQREILFGTHNPQGFPCRAKIGERPEMSESDLRFQA